MVSAWLIRRMRLLSLAAFIAPLCLLVYIYFSREQYVDIDRLLANPVVHGKHAGGPTKDVGPLQPFPESPMEASPNRTIVENNPWLVAVSSDATDAKRRHLIRSTWMKLYQDYPFDGRFVVSNAGSQWTESLQAENRTFGDLIVLDHISEDDFTACTIKAFELFKWLLKQDRKYEYVTKTETDVWFNVPNLWNNYLMPRISNDTGHMMATANRTIIASLWYVDVGLVIPYGPLYTMTWDLVELFALLQERYNLVYGEDVAMTMLMRKAGEVVNFINFGGEELFNYDETDERGDGTAWARFNTHQDAMQHALKSDKIIAAHSLKDEAVFLKVADCFDESGLKPIPHLLTESEAPTAAAHLHDFLYWLGVGTRHMSALAEMPDRLFKYVDGEWICDDVWRLGKYRTGLQ